MTRARPTAGARSRGDDLAQLLVIVVALGACGRIGYVPDAGTDAGLEARDGGIDAAIDAGAPIDAAIDAVGLDAGFDVGLDDAAIDDDAYSEIDANTDATGTDAFCPGVPEQCNGLDDDCDELVDETFRVVASWDVCASPSRTGGVTVVGSSWDASDALRSAMLVEGGIELVFPITTPGALLLAPELTIGNLLVAPPSTSPQGAALPFVGGDTTLEPSVDRVGFEVGFQASFVVYDGLGDDLVVLEQGDPITEPEAYTVAVRDARTGVWSRRRWEFFDGFSDTDLLFATRYDLAQFDLPGGVIDRIRIESVFGADAAMPDRVSAPRGDGFVLRGDDRDWASAETMLLTAGGAPVPVDLLDADLLWVASLHPLVEPTCCVP